MRTLTKALLVVLASVTVAVGKPPPDPAKMLAEGAWLLATERREDVYEASVTATTAKTAFDKEWNRIVVLRWNDLPGKDYFSKVMTPEHYGTVTGDLIVASAQKADADAWYAAGNSLVAVGDYLYTMGVNEFNAGNYSTAYDAFDTAETVYRVAAEEWYLPAAAKYDLGNVYLWDASVIISQYWANP